MKDKMRESRKGYIPPPITEKHRENLRLSHLGQRAWNRGKKMGEDFVHGMLGKEHRKDSRQKMSESHKGKKISKASRKKTSESLKMWWKKRKEGLTE